jgi:hypothetical protein
VRSGCGVPSREILGNHGVVAIRRHYSAQVRRQQPFRSCTAATRHQTRRKTARLARELARGVCRSLAEHPQRSAPLGDADSPDLALQTYLMCIPEIARAITSCWISAVPSKMS